MATTQSLPKTQEGSLARNAIRRSVTVPTKLQPTDTRQAVVEIGAAEGIETLFVHPSAKVVSFTTSSASIASPSRIPANSGEQGTLPWTTPAERTLAAGMLEIYRVPGSVSFLHSGSLLHAILPKSQCWCVDGVSIFVFRVLPNQYYRIELPGTTDEDLRLVEEMKITFQKVLYYERTACPFKRGFSVELPEEPQSTPRRKSRAISGPAKKWKLNGVWRPEDEDRWEQETTLNKGEEDNETRRQDSASLSDHGKDDACLQEARWDSSDDETDLVTPRPKKPSTLRDTTRSVTAPPKLTLIASPPSKSATKAENEARNPASIDAVASLVASISEIKPEPVARKDDLTHTESSHAYQQSSQQEQSPNLSNFTPTSPVSQGILSEDDMVEGRIWSAISTPSLSSDSEGHSWGEVTTPPETLRVKRSRNAVRGEKKPTRASSQISVTRRGSKQSQILDEGLVKKTMGIFLGPPSHLVTLMLKIAARVSSGAFKQLTIRSPLGTPQRVPGSWHLSEEEDEWDIDDYGFPVGTPASVQQRALRARA